jgi:hypothetical protein
MFQRGQRARVYYFERGRLRTMVAEGVRPQGENSAGQNGRDAQGKIKTKDIARKR